MEWTKEHDRALVDEMTDSPERGQVWDSIADNLNAMDYPKFKVAKRSCRDRWTLLRTKYKRRMSEELKASGIDAEFTESDAKETLQLTVAKMERRKQKLTKRQPKKYGRRPWNVLESQAREMVMKGREPKRKKRKSGSNAVEFLREKAKLDHSLKEGELQLRKDQQNQTLLLLQQQQQMNQAFLSLVHKMLSKEKK